MSTTAASRMVIPVPSITFGDRMRRLRISLNMTQDEFGSELGVAGGTVGRYELLDEPPRTWRMLRNTLELLYGRPVADWVVGPTPGGVWVTQRDYATAA